MKQAIGGFVFALTCLTAQAQSTNLRADIPFEFRIGGTVLPPGSYTIQSSGSALIVREQRGSHVAVDFFTLAAMRPQALTTGQLVFNRYGNTYFLAKIWTPGSQDGREFRRSPQEKEAAGDSGRLSAAVALRRQ